MLGAIVGTVEYMAPEQARGETVDQRADIYTTGLILYDLLAGAAPREHAGSAIDELQARMAGRRPPIRSVVPDVPEALAAIVTRGVEPDPAKRFQTTAELAAALERARRQRRAEAGQARVVCAAVVAAVALLRSLLGRRLVVSRGAAAAGRARSGLGRHRRLSRTAPAMPTFDRTLEPMLRRALEGADVHHRLRPQRHPATVGVALPERLDEAAARELAVKQGLGSCCPARSRSRAADIAVAMKATQAVTGDGSPRSATAPSGRTRSSRRDHAGGSVRKALGDATSESEPIFAMASLSATSLDVVRYYAAAMESQSNNQFEEARQTSAEGGRAGSEVRRRLPGARGDLAQPGRAAGRQEIHQ